jgi:hypothetical protein
MKLLFSSASLPEVGLVKSLLDGAGIASEVRNESSYPNFPGAGFQPEIWVIDEEDYPKACEIRDASQFSQPAGAPSMAQENPKQLRTNRTWAAITGCLMLVLGGVCLASGTDEAHPARGMAAVFFGCFGTLLTWLGLVGWRGEAKKP